MQTLAAEIDAADGRKLKHIDLRHSRIPEAGKKVRLVIIIINLDLARR